MVIKRTRIDRDDEYQRGEIERIVDEALIEDADEIDHDARRCEHQRDQQIAIEDISHLPELSFRDIEAGPAHVNDSPPSRLKNPAATGQLP
jgi:hypothetical protein